MLPPVPLLTAALLATTPWAGALPWHVKVRPGLQVRGLSHARISAARNECEDFQLLVPEAAQDVTVQPSALKGPGAPLRLDLFREEFVQLTTPSNSQGGAGPWPDPLLPLARGAQLVSTAQHPLVLLARACVGPDQQPGRYGGTITFAAKGRAKVAVSVQLDVQPFTLPATSSLPNSFGLSLYSIAKGHHLSPESPQARALLREYATLLLQHRVSAHGLTMAPPRTEVKDGQVMVDFTDFDRELGPFLEGKVLDNGARFSTLQIPDAPRNFTPAQKVAYFRQFRDHLTARQWTAQPFFYAKDEPTPKDYPLVLEQGQLLHQAGGIPVLVTSPYEPKLLAAADILAPTLNCFFSRPGPQTCRAVMDASALRAKLGPEKKIWWYQSCNSQGCTGGPAKDPAIERVYTGWPSYMVDHPATLNRAMGPLAFAAGIGGELYYDAVLAYDHGDPWTSLFEFGGNGDGTLVYPGTPARLGGDAHHPVSSLRLESLRDGLEDYEYLRLVSQIDPGLAKRSVARLARSGYDVEQDGSAWDAVRAEWTQALRKRASAKTAEYQPGQSVHPTGLSAPQTP